MEYPFIAIAPRSILAVSGSNALWSTLAPVVATDKVLSMGQIELNLCLTELFEIELFWI